MPLLIPAFKGNTVSQAAMLALSAVVDDWTVRTDLENTVFQLAATPASTLANWTQINTPFGSGSSTSTTPLKELVAHIDDRDTGNTADRFIEATADGAGNNEHNFYYFNGSGDLFKLTMTIV